MKNRFFLRFIFTSLTFLSLSIPLSAGGGKDKVLEEKIPLEKQEEDVQQPNQELEKDGLQGEIQESSQEPPQETTTENLTQEPPQETISQDSTQVPELEPSAKEDPVQQLLKDGRGRPRLHLYGEEEAAILSTNTNRSMVTKAEGNFSHILYDEEYRLKSRLLWKEGDTSLREGENYLAPSELIIQEDYFYYDDTRNRQKIVLTNFKDVSRNESFFSQDGLLLKEELYLYVPDKEEDKKLSGEKIPSQNPLPQDPWANFPSVTLVQVTEYQYNQDKALTEMILTLHSEEERFVKKTVYHNPGNIHGGFDYFENEELLISRKYLDESQYTETRYFDNMKVDTLYDGARLISEVVYLDGKEIRRTEF